jgi:hypothetical protein
MAAGWKLTPTMRMRLAWIARLRWLDPGDNRIAQECGVTVRTVQYHLNRLRVSETNLLQGAVIPRSWMIQSQPHDRDACATDSPPHDP